MHFWNMDDYQDRLPWYQSLFDGDEKVKGEITPAYAMLGRDRIKEIYHLFPKLRLVYLIRNPVDRAWSNAMMALPRIQMTLEEASDQWFIDHFRSKGSIMRGDYASCIQTWHHVYPKEQLLVLKYDDLRDNPRELLFRCCTHLGVDKDPIVKLSEEKMRVRVFPGNGTRIRPTLVPVLLDIYTPRIERLSEYLGEDFSGWLRETNY